MSEPQRYFFLHIPKTAGSVLVQKLMHQFGGDAVYPQSPYRGEPGAYIDLDYLENKWRSHRAEIVVLTGHFPLCATDVLGVPFSTFTVLRDPVERTLSLLRQHKQRDEQFRDSSLEDIYADPVLLHAMIHNYMVKVLSMTPAEMTRSAMSMVPYDEARLEVAKHNLEHRIEVVGLHETFADFCSQLELRYGWDLGVRARYPNRTTPVDVGDELRARIAQDSRFDVELYRFAAALVARRRSERSGSS